MKAIRFKLNGRWAHFKKPETNNNPLTHDIITKTALIGLIGAVIGKDRITMRSLYPEFSEGMLYNIILLKDVKKLSFGFTMRKAVNIESASRKAMEVLVSPSYLITLALKDPKVESYFTEFTSYLKQGFSCYTPVLGLHNCPATLSLVSEGSCLIEDNKAFETSGFITAGEYEINLPVNKFRIGFDRIPTYQNNDFWNLPEYYKEIIYPSAGQKLSVSGRKYVYSDEPEGLCLI